MLSTAFLMNLYLPFLVPFNSVVVFFFFFNEVLSSYV
jgi:hypothetical protein